MKKTLFQIFVLVTGFALFLPLACTYSNNSAFPLKTTSTATPCTGILGNSTIEATVSGNTNVLFLNRFQATSDSSLVSITAYVNSAGAHAQYGVYADDGSGNPTTLLADTGARYTNVYPDGWFTIPLSSPLGLVNGTYYWLAIHTDDAFRSLAGSGIGFGSQNIGLPYGSFPATYTGGPHAPNAALISIYGTTCP